MTGKKDILEISQLPWNYKREKCVSEFKKGSSSLYARKKIYILTIIDVCTNGSNLNALVSIIKTVPIT